MRSSSRSPTPGTRSQPGSEPNGPFRSRSSTMRRARAGPDAGQPLEFLEAGAIRVDPLPLGQRSGELHQTVAPREGGVSGPGAQDRDGSRAASPRGASAARAP